MLKRRAFAATLWSGGEVFLRQGIQFVVAIVLARLLSPSDFGTIALLYLFTGIATVFVDGGFSAALIQRQDTSHVDESTVFWFNAAIGATTALLLWLAAPAIARFYAQPVLVPLMGVLALNVLLAALGAIHATLLGKRLDFRTLLKVNVGATVVSAAVAIWMALHGFGVWALAAQALVMTSLSTALLWIANRWRPAWTFSADSARRLAAFGGYNLAANLLEIVYARFYTLLIGKFHGVRALGFYNNADTTRQMPAGFVTGVLARVAFPLFAAAADDKARLRRGMQLAVRGLMLVNVPVMFAMIALAKPLVLTLFGAQWLPAVPILRVLCLAGVVWPLHVINLNVLMAQGHSAAMFRLEIAKKIVGVALLFVGSLYGVMGIAWSQVAFGVIGFAVNTWYTRRLLGYGALAQARDFLPALGIAFAMAALLHVVAAWWHPAPALELVTLGLGGAVFFLVLARLLRLDALTEIVLLLRASRAATPEAAP